MIRRLVLMLLALLVVTIPWVRVVEAFDAQIGNSVLHDPETSLGIRIGTGIFHSSDTFDEITHFSTPTILGLVGGIRQGDFGLELSVDYLKTNLKSSIKIGTLTTVPSLLTAQLHPMPEEDPFDPYIGFGGGYYINSFSPSSEAKDAAAAVGVNNYDASVENTPGLHVSAGANMKISNVFAFTIDARYTLLTRATIKDNFDSDTLKMNGFFFTIGAKYFFPE